MAASPPSPPLFIARQWRREMPFMAAVFALSLLLYAFTTPSTVLLQDDGIFIGTLHFFGVAHPPGYPLHTLVGGIFYHLLPFGTPAYKAHLFSGVAAAAAVAAIYAVTARLTPGRITPLAAALTAATSKNLWSQAVLAEVYTLNALLFFLLVLATLRVVEQQERTPWRAAVICGLGLANHHPLFILASGGIAVYALFHLRHRLRALLIGIPLALATAAPFYLWMIWRSHSNVPANFYGIPLDSSEQFFYYILRRGYSGVDNQTGVSWQDKLDTTEFLLDNALSQFTWAGAVLAVIGFAVLLRQRRTLAIGFLLSILATSPLLIILRDFPAIYLNLAIFSVYHITSYGIMAIALAIGCNAVAAKLGGRWRGAVAALLAVGVATASLVSHWPANNRRHDTWAEDLARTKLATADVNAYLFMQGDFDFPLGYLRYVKGERPDLTLLNLHGFIYGSPLYNPFIPLTDAPEGQLSKQDILQKFAANSTRPVLFPPRLAYIFESEGNRSDMIGFFRRINHQPTRSVKISPLVLQWLRENDRSNADDENQWTRLQKDGAVGQIVATALAAHWSGSPLTPEWHDTIARIRGHNLRVDMLMTEYELRQGQLDEAQVREKLGFCAAPDDQVLHYIDNIERSDFFLLCAQLARHLHGEDSAEGERYLQHALAQSSSIENPAFSAALQRYRQQDAPCRTLDLLRRFTPDGDALPPELQAHRQAAEEECR